MILRPLRSFIEPQFNTANEYTPLVSMRVREGQILICKRRR